MYQTAIQDENIFNPTIFSCYGQTISKVYGMLCRYITFRDTTHVSHLHDHVRECIYGLSAGLCVCLLYQASPFLLFP